MASIRNIVPLGNESCIFDFICKNFAWNSLCSILPGILYAQVCKFLIIHFKRFIKYIVPITTIKLEVEMELERLKVFQYFAGHPIILCLIKENHFADKAAPKGLQVHVFHRISLNHSNPSN